MFEEIIDEFSKSNEKYKILNPRITSKINANIKHTNPSCSNFSKPEINRESLEMAKRRKNIFIYIAY